MKPGIQSIRVNNFKAFHKEEKIRLDGKNLLVYGENGSGKSSIYFALYTFLQCSNLNKDYKKYFSRHNNENLLNIHSKKNDSFIELEVTDDKGLNHVFHLSQNRNNLRRNNIIKEMDVASDFISHRLLVGFYNFRNSKEINLFSVFERDIFPYFYLITDIGQEYFSDVFLRLKTKLPVRKVRAKIELVDQKSNIFINYENLLKSFNKELENLIQQINLQVNDYYKNIFNSGKDDLQISIELKEILSINNVITKLELNDPFIKLFIYRKNGNKLIKIDRPQSYLNEAKLTAIALSIRFTLLERRPIQTVTKVLALDDLLISLDMSHRENTLSLLLDRYSKNYQLIILTHDREFFYLAKNQIKLKKEINEWALYEMYVDDTEGFEQPFMTEFKSNLDRAEAFMLSFEFAAAANALRTFLEEFLITIIPLQERVNEDGFPINNFSLIDKAKTFLEKCKIPTDDLEIALKYKNTSLNPLSHYDIEKQIYRKELNDCIKLMRKLEREFLHFKAKKILKPGDELTLQINEGVKIHSFIIIITTNIYLFTINGQDFNLTSGKLKLIWQIDGIFQKHKINKTNLTSLLKEICNLTNNSQNQDPFMAYKLANGSLLNNLKVL
jgi:energy-coupling factor transporter ATP-binding protein EcfA2